MGKPWCPWCTWDHTKPHSYLLSTSVQSFGPPVILTRILHYYQELKLSDDQIRGLLDIAGEYQEDSLKASIEFSNVTAELESGERKLSIKQTEQLLDRHAELFRKHESLVLGAYERVKDILTEEQIRRSVKLFERQKEMLLDAVAPSLRVAVAPSLELVRKKRSGNVE